MSFSISSKETMLQSSLMKWRNSFKIPKDIQISIDIAAGNAAGMIVVSCEYGYGRLPTKIGKKEIRIDHPIELAKYIGK